MALAAGARLGPYVIKHLVGSGGMGEVYCAHDARLGRDVAVKVLPQTLSTDADRLSSSTGRLPCGSSNQKVRATGRAVRTPSPSSPSR